MTAAQGRGLAVKRAAELQHPTLVDTRALILAYATLRNHRLCPVV